MDKRILASKVTHNIINDKRISNIGIGKDIEWISLLIEHALVAYGDARLEAAAVSLEEISRDRSAEVVRALKETP